MDDKLKIGDKVMWIAYKKVYEIVSFSDHDGVFLKDKDGWVQHKEIKTVIRKFKKIEDDKNDNK